MTGVPFFIRSLLPFFAFLSFAILIVGEHLSLTAKHVVIENKNDQNRHSLVTNGRMKKNGEALL
jgi:V8-like Glu-specific endopeptidase